MEIILAKLFEDCVYNVKYNQTEKGANYAFVEEGDVLYIYFQHSTSISDWLRNFWLFKRPYKNMNIPYYVHGGFLSAWKEVLYIIIAKIKEVKTPHTLRTWYNDTDFIDRPNYRFRKIVIAGYSQGGALSGLCHECVWFNRPDIRHDIYGFGFESPRFYRGLFVKKALRERWYNYTIIRNHNDIVTHLPFKFLLFTHVGTMIRLNRLSTDSYKKPKFISSHLPGNVLEELKELHKK